ncbi:unnamed protein product [Pleuronectes platessa]|uniref:Uncharacterized protein n=1 Tax=Pleuronectes platessa TaxID=8262 RepID=A0A9N7TXV9_PLEPL|nr:unnamed protein product [Pleuronectes platessa]
MCEIPCLGSDIGEKKMMERRVRMSAGEESQEDSVQHHFFFFTAAFLSRKLPPLALLRLPSPPLSSPACDGGALSELQHSETNCSPRTPICLHISWIRTKPPSLTQKRLGAFSANHNTALVTEHTRLDFCGEWPPSRKKASACTLLQLFAPHRLFLSLLRCPRQGYHVTIMNAFQRKAPVSPRPPARLRIPHRNHRQLGPSSFLFSSLSLSTSVS